MKKMSSISKKLVAVLGITLMIVLMVMLPELKLTYNSISSDSELIKSSVLDDSIDKKECDQNLSVSLNGAYASDIAHEDGNENGCDAVSCRNASPCNGIAGCSYTEVCDGCSCSFEQVGSYQGDSRCGS